MNFKSFFIVVSVLSFGYVLIEYRYFDQTLFEFLRIKTLIANKLTISSLNKSSSQCSPFTNISSFSIEIDGELYPKWVSLSRNKSINYKCLNGNKKLKTILLKNKFFSREDHHYGLGKREPFIKNRYWIILFLTRKFNRNMNRFQLSCC